MKPIKERVINAKTVLITAIAVRMVWLIICFWQGFNPDTDALITSDSQSYYVPALHLAASGKFLSASGTPEINRTPGYPFFLSLCMSVSPDHWARIAVGLQYLLNLLAVYTLYKLIFSLTRGNNLAAFIGSMLAALNLHDIAYCNFILTDSLSQSISIFALYYFFDYLRSWNAKSQIISLILLTALLFIRPSGLYLPFALSAGAILVLALQKKWKKIVFTLLALSILTALPIFAWSQRNARETGYAGFTANSVITLYFFNCAGIVAHNEKITYYDALERMAELPSENGFTNNEEALLPYKQMARKLISENFALFIWLYLKGIPFLLFYPGTFDIFRVFPEFGAFIAHIQEAYGNSESLIVAMRTALASAYGWHIISGFLLLLAVNLLTMRGIRVCYKMDAISWYEKAALCACLLYFILICAGPVGYGAYSRYRLSFSMLQAIFCGMAGAEWIKAAPNFSKKTSPRK